MSISELYPPELIEQIRSFGMLGYSVEKIIDLIDPPDPDQLRLDFDTPGSIVYKAYRKGNTTGKYTLDKDIFDKAKNHDTDANIILTERMQKQRIDDTIFQNFGL
jgi:hypothetical protein